MICFVISVNDRTVCTAGAEDTQAGSVLLCAIDSLSVGSSGSLRRFRIDAKAAADDTEMVWLEEFDEIQVGDTITVRIMECAQPDPPRTSRVVRARQLRAGDRADDHEDRCCFCHRAADEHRRLIAGPPVFICDGCVGVCVDTLAHGADRETREHRP